VTALVVPTMSYVVRSSAHPCSRTGSIQGRAEYRRRWSRGRLFSSALAAIAALASPYRDRAVDWNPVVILASGG